MSNYKNTYELYKSTFDVVFAPDELIQRIKNMDTKQIKNKKIKFISTIAACLVVVMIVAFIISIFSVQGNSFVLKANAAEIGGKSFVEITKVSPITSESGSVIEENKQTYTYNCIIPFAIICDGRNIKSIKYTAKNAVFLFPYESYLSEYREKYPDEASASGKIKEKIESNSKIESYAEKDKQYSSYIVSFDEQINTEIKDYAGMQSFPIQLLTSISSEDSISQEAKDAFNRLHTKSDNNSLLSDESVVNEIFNNFKVIYCEMYKKISVTAEIRYEDGTIDYTSLRFDCLSADQKNGIVIGAKTTK